MTRAMEQCPHWPRFAHVLAQLQGLYYLLSGAWPLVSIGTFQQVTGPKVDLWLVKTVGVLVTVVGLVLMLAGLKRCISPEIYVLALGSSAAFAAVDLNYALKGRISDIYLLDAIAELVMVALWLGLGAAQLKGRSSRTLQP